MEERLKQEAEQVRQDYQKTLNRDTIRFLDARNRLRNVKWEQKQPVSLSFPSETQVEENAEDAELEQDIAATKAETKNDIHAAALLERNQAYHIIMDRIKSLEKERDKYLTELVMVRQQEQDKKQWNEEAERRSQRDLAFVRDQYSKLIALVRKEMKQAEAEEEEEEEEGESTTAVSVATTNPVKKKRKSQMPRDKDAEPIFDQPIQLSDAHRQALSRTDPSYNSLFEKTYRFCVGLLTTAEKDALLLTERKRGRSYRQACAPKDSLIWRMDAKMDPLFTASVHMTPTTFDDDVNNYIHDDVHAALLEARNEINAALATAGSHVRLTLFDLVISKSLSPLFRSLVREHYLGAIQPVGGRSNKTRFATGMDIKQRTQLLKRFAYTLLLPLELNGPLEFAV